MKKNLVRQEELDHKIWGAVSVIITRRNMECFLRPLVCCFQEGTNKSSEDRFFKIGRPLNVSLSPTKRGQNHDIGH